MGLPQIFHGNPKCSLISGAVARKVYLIYFSVSMQALGKALDDVDEDLGGFGSFGYNLLRVLSTISRSMMNQKRLEVRICFSTS